ncbi:LysM peptidoglycan-binding domain-containing protein [Vibrio hyugaensis]|uniref:LysM peptidoglycan-binding domain-containing protein n=1 Tax=Vibrio hyugaensis TaxID=1534743 RepID=UPI000CE49D65|nr:outer membrane beta-barrel protein [Vibrio hyugaensis]
MNRTTFIMGIIAGFSSVAIAEPTNWYVGGSLTHNGKTDTEFSDSSFGGGIKLGYQLSPTWAIEASTGTYGQLDMLKVGEYRNTTQNISRYGTDLSLLGTLPLSKRYKLYGGLGMISENDELSPIAQIGIRYELNPLWAFNFGYKFLSSQEPDYKLQSLGFGIQYRFQNTNTQVPSPVYDEIQVASETQTDKQVISVMEYTDRDTECKANIYRVKEGDWLYKIASQHHISFTELMSANDSFKALPNIDVIYPEETVIIPNLLCE